MQGDINMDVRDVLTPSNAKFPFKGSYYEKPFQDPTQKRIGIRYKFENPQSKVYKALFSNVQDFSGSETAIRTNKQEDFKIGGVIVMQDGKAYTITDCMTDYNTVSQEVFRLVNNAPGVERVLRLISRENAWGIK